MNHHGNTNHEKYNDESKTTTRQIQRVGYQTKPLKICSKIESPVEPRWTKQQTKKPRHQPTKNHSFKLGPSYSLKHNPLAWKTFLTYGYCSIPYIIHISKKHPDACDTCTGPVRLSQESTIIVRFFFVQMTIKNVVSARSPRGPYDACELPTTCIRATGLRF